MKVLTNYFAGYRKQGGIKELLLLAYPMIVSTASDGIMTFTDRIFLARLGPEYMNAAMGGGVTLLTLTLFFIGLTGYSTALVAQYYGAGDKKNASATTFQAGIIAIVAWLVIVLCIPLLFWFFGAMDVPASQINLQKEYTQILAWGSVTGLLRHTLSCYFTGIGKTRIVMMATLAALVVNVILDYLLITGAFGISPMGVEGAAYATVSGAFTAFIILLFAYLNKKNRVEFFVMQSFRYSKIVMKKLLYYGSPAGFEMLLNLFAFSIVINMLHSEGEVEATASTIMFNWDLMSFIPLLGIEIAVTSLVGRYMGAGRPQVAHRAAVSGVKIGLFYSLFVLILFVFFPYWLVMLFQPQEFDSVFNAAIPLSINMIQIASLYVLAEAVLVAYIGALRGAGDTYFTMFASVSLHWLMVPVLFLSLRVWDFGILTAWSIIVVLFLCFCSVLYFRFKSGKWKKIRVINPPLNS
ncbi:MAG: MATE family efflux transporter [Bacteroidales bacterium]|nr:MATE family efflux transporter [Bacteroidales bacterium]